jgi:AcrR family transcriptional regulator
MTFENDVSAGEQLTSAFDRKAQYDIKRRILLYEAARMAMESKSGTLSLTELARNLNITKAALYYYFKNKQEILFECYSLSFDAADEALELALVSGFDAAQKIELFVYNYMLSGLKDLYRTMSLRTMPLSPAYSQRILERRDVLHGKLRELVAEGIKDGSIAPCIPKFAVSTIIGAISELLRIYNPAGEVSAEEIAEHAAIQLADGFSRGRESVSDSARHTSGLAVGPKLRIASAESTSINALPARQGHLP